MTLARVNVLNIGLMIGSLIAAILLPFHVFLLSYAILGPLHYLTEMSWLHDRKYFLPERRLALPIALLILGAVLAAGLFPNSLTASTQPWNTDLIFGAFVTSLVLLLCKSARQRWLGAAAVAILVVIAHYVNAAVRAPIVAQLAGRTGDAYMPFTIYDMVFMLFLNTIVHVLVFTGAFVVYGALKAKSWSGHLSFAVFVACAAACFVPAAHAVDLADSWRRPYQMTSELLAYLLVFQFGGTPLRDFNDIYANELGIKFARLIAFAYTYHYLNWFSKTSVIRWHEVPKSRFAAVIALWIGSVSLYAFDMTTGIRWLLVLSMLHVALEFPLNWQSFFGIGQELWRRVRTVG